MIGGLDSVHQGQVDTIDEVWRGRAADATAVVAGGGEAADRGGDAGAWGFGFGGGSAARRERQPGVQVAARVGGR